MIIIRGILHITWISECVHNFPSHTLEEPKQAYLNYCFQVRESETIWKLLGPSLNVPICQDVTQ